MALSSPWSRLIAQRLAALGVELHVVDLQARGEGGYLGTGAAAATDSVSNLESRVASAHRVLPPRPMLPRLIYSARALRRIARENKADVVLSLYGGSLAATAYLSGIRPYVVYVVGSDVLLASWGQKQISRVTLPAAAAVVANGKFLATKTRELVPTANLTALYMGADVERLSFSERSASSPTFVCTRGFLGVYDNATIIRAFGRLDDAPSAIAISFLSTGPLLAESIALADQLIPPSWRGKMVFSGGVSDSAIKDALQSNSYYLSASLSDGASSSLLEAMACGLFPIISDIPANREWITHEKNGMLFPAGDDSALSVCIRRAIVGEPWMAQARISNRRLVEEHANIDVSMKALVALLTSTRADRNKA
jgi:glycosyltransferase involved in cell wall biosynthesis